MDYYTKICEEAQERFYSRHWQCEEQDKHKRRCVNIESCHDKGHQDSNGKVFSKGPYQSHYKQHKQEEKVRFLGRVRSNLDRLLKTKASELECQPERKEEETELVYELHRRMTLKNYTTFWADVTRIVSHASCLSCLASVPIHTLKCGHLICEGCLIGYSLPLNGARRAISVCPLCCNIDHPWPRTWVVSLKPPTAGVRILSLDGFVLFFPL
jgi:hypothetical protein